MAKKKEVEIEVKSEVIVPETKQAVKESIPANSCPWCAKEKQKSSIIIEAGRVQCSTCGKTWNESDLGKEWTIELERGEKWAREMKARQALQR